MRFRLSLLLSLFVAWSAEASYQAGVGVRKITPEGSMWLAGYAGRNKPSEGVEIDLFAKALALEDEKATRLVIVTADLISMPRRLAEEVHAEVAKKIKLPRANLMLTVSHTHCSPVINDNLLGMYPMPEGEAKKVESYTVKLKGLLVEAILAAVADLKPATLSVGKSTARFAVNRRKMTDKGVTNDANPAGPVDHDVPVLQVFRAKKLLAVLFGYACHNTTLAYYRFSGDYAGFAQAAIQEKNPGTVAMFWTGCGGDANPLPRGTVELCKKYGKELATAVQDVIKERPKALSGTFAVHYGTMELPFGELPKQETLEAEAKSKSVAHKSRAELLLKQIAEKGELQKGYPHYPVQVWRLGDGVVWVALGGEVVVDYAIRLKKSLTGRRAVWVTGYANDVCAYIPSARVIKEGGYEGDSSQVYYGMPGKWSPKIEDAIVNKVEGFAKEVMKE